MSTGENTTIIKPISSADTAIRIFICTPCYSYTCDLRYVQALMKTIEFFNNKSINIEVSFIGYESLIPRARNTFVARFLSNPSNTHLLFIDGDLVWEPTDILKLLQSDKDVIGGIYPQKQYIWDRLHKIKTKNELPKLLNYNINYIKNKYEVIDSLIQVKDIATGFMMIKRHVLLKLINHYKNKQYKDNIHCCHVQEQQYLYALFDCNVIDGYYLSEDYYFCYLWRKIGGEIYANFSINLTHIGSEKFEGNLCQKYQLKNTV